MARMPSPRNSSPAPRRSFFTSSANDRSAMFEPRQSANLQGTRNVTGGAKLVQARPCPLILEHIEALWESRNSQFGDSLPFHHIRLKHVRLKWGKYRLSSN